MAVRYIATKGHSSTALHSLTQVEVYTMNGICTLPPQSRAQLDYFAHS